MTRLDRYLLGEMVLPFISGVLLIVVMLVGNTLYPLIQQIAQANIGLPVVAKLVVFNLPTLVILTLPAATALSAAWAINRLARDSEITAIRMSGVPVRRIFLPIYVVGVVVSIVAFLIGDRVVPRAQHEFQQTQSQMAAYAFIASPEIAQDQVFKYNEYSFIVRTIRKSPSGNTNKLRLEGVTIFRGSVMGTFPEIYTARTADYDRDVWTLHDFVLTTMGADGMVAAQVTGKTLTLNLHVPLASLAESAFIRPDEMTMRELGNEMRALAKTGRQNADVAINYYSKLSLPFVCLAFALCAPPLALRFARAGAYMGIFLSLIMVWVGWNTLLLTKYLGSAGKLDPFVAAWSPDILFLILGIFFLRRVE